MRQDLEWIEHTSPARWIVRDPLTASFFSLSQVERAAARLMDGSHPLSDILLSVRRMFPALQIDRRWLHALLLRLQMHHLTTDASPRRLNHLRQKLRRRNWLQQAMSPLAIRIPLLNPTFALERFRIPARILFHPWMIAASMVMAALLFFWVLCEFLGSHWSLAVDLSSIQGDRWLMLFVCYVVAKSLHELGHAVACVHTKTECNEVGVMFLCLAPCLYCDTTDSWKLPSKWQRAGIAAAGMYVELILATLAAAVWLATRDGTYHYVAASMMIVCSTGTLLVNSNPFLKYDGYYILSDLWGVPNLAEQGREALRSLGKRWLTGRRPHEFQFDAPVVQLAAYAVIASIYRTFILCVILWIAWSTLVPLGLGLVALVLSVAMLTGLVLSSLHATSAFVRSLQGLRSLRFFPVVLSCIAVCVGIGFLFQVPLPSRVLSRGVTDYANKTPLFASQSAELVYAAPHGRIVPRGEKLLGFSSSESDFELLVTQGAIDGLEQDLLQLRSRSVVDASIAYQIPRKTEELADLRTRLQLLSRESDALDVVAQQDGFLLAGPVSGIQTLSAPRNDRFQNHPLDPVSLGCYVERGTLLGWLSDKRDVTVTALVPEREVKRLTVGMKVLIQWDANVAGTTSGQIVRIAPEAATATPPQLVGDPGLISIRNQAGVYEPEKPHFEVTVSIVTAGPSSGGERTAGALATLQIELPAQTLSERIVDAVRLNLKLP